MIKDVCMSILFKWNQKIHIVKWSSFGNSQRNVICYFKCKTRDEKETYIGKTIEDKKRDLKLEEISTFLIAGQRMQHVSSSVVYTIVVLRITA